jgi:hypothetical protein
MTEAAAEYQRVAKWQPHRANPLVLKPKLPDLPGIRQTALGVSPESGEEPAPVEHLTVQARLLQRLRRLPMTSRFGHMTDLFKQIEKVRASY